MDIKENVDYANGGLKCACLNGGIPRNSPCSKHGLDGPKRRYLLILICSSERLALHGKYRSAPSSMGAVLPMLLLLVASNKEIVKGPDAAKRGRVGPHRDAKADVFLHLRSRAIPTLDPYPRSEEPQMSATPCAARCRTGIIHATSKATLTACTQFKSLSDATRFTPQPW